MDPILAVFSADDMTIKGVITALCVAILHLYRNDRKCRETAAETDSRLKVLEVRFTDEQGDHDKLQKQLDECPTVNCWFKLRPMQNANSATGNNPIPNP